MEDKREEHLTEVWFHELQDHANVIANLPTLYVVEKARNAYYEGFAMGINGDISWEKDKENQIQSELGHRQGDMSDIGSLAEQLTVSFASLSGFYDGCLVKTRIMKEDRSNYRLKIYESIKKRMSAIAPWEDQTRKPL